METLLANACIRHEQVKFFWVALSAHCCSAQGWLKVGSRLPAATLSHLLKAALALAMRFQTLNYNHKKPSIQAFIEAVQRAFENLFA